MDQSCFCVDRVDADTSSNGLNMSHPFFFNGLENKLLVFRIAMTRFLNCLFFANAPIHQRSHADDMARLKSWQTWFRLSLTLNSSEFQRGGNVSHQCNLEIISMQETQIRSGFSRWRRYRSQNSHPYNRLEIYTDGNIGSAGETPFQEGTFKKPFKL